MGFGDFCAEKNKLYAKNCVAQKTKWWMFTMKNDGIIYMFLYEIAGNKWIRILIVSFEIELIWHKIVMNESYRKNIPDWRKQIEFVMKLIWSDASNYLIYKQHRHLQCNLVRIGKPWCEVVTSRPPSKWHVHRTVSSRSTDSCRHCWSKPICLDNRHPLYIEVLRRPELQ